MSEPDIAESIVSSLHDLSMICLQERLPLSAIEARVNYEGASHLREWMRSKSLVMVVMDVSENFHAPDMFMFKGILVEVHPELESQFLAGVRRDL